MNINNTEFIAFLEDWRANLPVISPGLVADSFDKVAIVSVDLIKGFCDFGPLASPRVAAIVPAVTELMTTLKSHGLQHFLLSQDAHSPEAVEFGAWPPHCVRGSAEAETVDEIRRLPFFDQFTILEKNSISSDLSDGLAHWIDSHPQVSSYIVVGDCTDLCTYQLAMFLRLSANQNQAYRRVIVPANCVATYDLPVDPALKLGILPHPGDLLDAIFLYHMALNGVEVVAAIQ